MSNTDDAYLELLTDVRKQFLRFRKRMDSEWMDRSDVFRHLALVHIAWARAVEFLAHELGIEPRVNGMMRPGWPDLPSALPPIHELGEEADRIISGVYEGVLPVLGRLELNTEDDDLQWIVEDFADRVCEWSGVGADDE